MSVVVLLQKSSTDEEDTLILTAMNSDGTDHDCIDTPDLKAREIFFATVSTKLRKRGISLRHQV